MDKGDSPWSLMLDIEGVSPQVTALKSCRTPPLLSFQASCRKPIGKHHQAEMPQQGLTPLPRLFLTGDESGRYKPSNQLTTRWGADVMNHPHPASWPQPENTVSRPAVSPVADPLLQTGGALRRPPGARGMLHLKVGRR